MGADREPGWVGPGDADVPELGVEPGDDGYGPPSWIDDIWFSHHVVALEYPKVRLGDVQYEGQMSIEDALDQQSYWGPEGKP